MTSQLLTKQPSPDVDPGEDDVRQYLQMMQAVLLAKTTH